nr:hypothetical protein [Tanacetum cinerariifolium]
MMGFDMGMDWEDVNDEEPELIFLYEAEAVTLPPPPASPDTEHMVDIKGFHALRATQETTHIENNRLRRELEEAQISKTLMGKGRDRAERAFLFGGLALWMTTLGEHIIIAGAENYPLMLEKSMYDSWASRIRLFIKGNKHGRMMLDSIDNDLLVYPTVEENRQTKPNKYSKLTEAQQLQDDCDVQAMNIILHRLLPNVYALVNHQEAAKDSGLAVPMFQQGEDSIECINKAMAFLSVEASRFPPSNNRLRTSSNPIKQETNQDDPGISEAPVSQQTIPQNLAFQIDDLDAYESDCDDLSLAKAI